MEVFPTPLESIRIKTLLYHKTMNAIIDKLTACSSDINLDKNKQFIQFYIDKPGLKALNQIAALRGFDSLIGFFGIDDDEKGNKITVSFVGADKNKKILKQHKGKYQTKNQKNNTVKLNQAMPGEDQWPQPPPTAVAANKISLSSGQCLFNLKSDPAVIDKVFTEI